MLNRLPRELIELICSKLRFKDILSLIKTCRHLYHNSKVNVVEIILGRPDAHWQKLDQETDHCYRAYGGMWDDYTGCEGFDFMLLSPNLRAADDRHQTAEEDCFTIETDQRVAEAIDFLWKRSPHLELLDLELHDSGHMSVVSQISQLHAQLPKKIKQVALCLPFAHLRPEALEIALTFLPQFPELTDLVLVWEDPTPDKIRDRFLIDNLQPLKKLEVLQFRLRYNFSSFALGKAIASDAIAPELKLTTNLGFGTHFNLHEFLQGIKESTVSGTCPRLTRIMYTKKSQRGKSMFSDKLRWDEVFQVLPNLRKLMADFYPKKHKDLPDIYQNMIDVAIAGMRKHVDTEKEMELFISGRVMLASEPPRKRYNKMIEFLVTKARNLFTEKFGPFLDIRVEAPPYKTFEEDSLERDGTLFPILVIKNKKLTAKLLFGFAFHHKAGLDYGEEYESQDFVDD